MFSFLRPFIFNLDPENAHDLAIKSLKVDLIPEVFYKTEGEDLLKINVLPKPFKNPFLVADSTLALRLLNDGRLLRKDSRILLPCSLVPPMIFPIFSSPAPYMRAYMKVFAWSLDSRPARSWLVL